jgi:hypothetical protein
MMEKNADGKKKHFKFTFITKPNYRVSKKKHYGNSTGCRAS